MRQGPQISAVIVVRDGERYLGEAIGSALAQELAPCEVIVIDDGSIDGSRATAEEFVGRVRCVSIEPRGIGGARNVGVDVSTGEWVAFLDADDVWHPRSLRVLAGAFADDPGLELAFGHVRQFISPDLDAAAAGRLTLRSELEPGYLVGASLIRRSALDRVGPFLEEFLTGDFIDWVARARDLGVREKLLGDHVLSRRLHTTNHGIVRLDRRVDYAHVLKRALDRRRAAGSLGDEIVQRERPTDDQ